jgi:hypothetical protein
MPLPLLFRCSARLLGSVLEPVFDFTDLVCLLVFMVFFLCLLLGFGLSPFTKKDRESGRPVGEVFRGHHWVGPLMKAGW